MRINNNELDAIRQASHSQIPTQQPTFFTLPKFSKHIPTESTTTDVERAFAKTLIESGTIDVSRLPETLTSARQIVEVGLQTWLKDRVPKLNVINVCASIISPSVLKEVITEEDSDYGEPTSREFNGGFGLTINGPDCFTPMLFGDSAVALESEHPGLWKTALKCIEAAAEISVPIRMPESIYYLNAYMWDEWGVIESISSIPSDESARENLEYHFEGSEEEIQKYLPSSVVKLLGSELAITPLSKKSERLYQKQIKQIAAKSGDEFAAIAAKLLLKLCKATTNAKKAGARMPNLSDMNCETTEPGCTLLFQYDDLIYQAVSNNYQELMESGRATHWTGLDELPIEPSKLKDYFTKLDLALKVLVALDDFLCHVTEPYTED